MVLVISRGNIYLQMSRDGKGKNHPDSLRKEVIKMSKGKGSALLQIKNIKN